MRKTRSVRAFTLLEMLLAIAVAGLLLAAAGYLVTSLSNIWVMRTDDDSFEEHADGVASFLQKAMDDSLRRYQPTFSVTDSSSDTDSDSDTDTTDSDDTSTDSSSDSESGTEKLEDAQSSESEGLWQNSGVSMEIIDGEISSAKPKLHFTFFQFPPMLGRTEPATTLGVEAWLLLSDTDGLLIVWKDIWSIQDSTLVDDEDLLRTSTVSPFVTKIDYIYWDEDSDRWLEYDVPHKFDDEYTLPEFIRLTFKDADHETTRLIRIPQSSSEMPVF